MERKNAQNIIHEALEELELDILEEQEDPATQWMYVALDTGISELDYLTIVLGPRFLTVYAMFVNLAMENQNEEFVRFANMMNSAMNRQTLAILPDLEPETGRFDGDTKRKSGRRILLRTGCSLVDDFCVSKELIIATMEELFDYFEPFSDMISSIASGATAKEAIDEVLEYPGPLKYKIEDIDDGEE